MDWLKEYAGLISLPIAVLAALFTGWNAFVNWRRDRSRFTLKITYPPSYKRGDVEVAAIYNGGPSLKVMKARVRVLRVARVMWFEQEPAPGVDAMLRPENREVLVFLNSDHRKHFWYVEVLTDGGARRRKRVRWFPPFWLKELRLGPGEMADVGAVGSERRFEKTLEAAVEELRREEKRKRKP